VGRREREKKKKKKKMGLKNFTAIFQNQTTRFLSKGSQKSSRTHSLASFFFTKKKTKNKKTIQPLSSALSLFATLKFLSCPTLNPGTIAAASTVPLT